MMRKKICRSIRILKSHPLSSPRFRAYVASRGEFDCFAKKTLRFATNREMVLKVHNVQESRSKLFRKSPLIKSISARRSGNPVFANTPETPLQTNPPTTLLHAYPPPTVPNPTLLIPVPRRLGPPVLLLTTATLLLPASLPLHRHRLSASWEACSARE
jgi:hypothetical protein